MEKMLKNHAKIILFLILAVVIVSAVLFVKG